MRPSRSGSSREVSGPTPQIEDAAGTLRQGKVEKRLGQKAAPTPHAFFVGRRIGRDISAAGRQIQAFEGRHSFGDQVPDEAPAHKRLDRYWLGPEPRRASIGGAPVDAHHTFLTDIAIEAG